MTSAKGPIRYQTVTEAAVYLHCSRQTMYRLIASGQLRPDGRVGRRLRFSRSTLDAYVRGVHDGVDSMGHSAGTEVHDAHQKISAETDACAGDLARRPGQVPGARAVERSTDGPEEEKGGRGDVVCSSGRSSGAAQVQRRASRQRFKAAVQRLRRAMNQGAR